MIDDLWYKNAIFYCLDVGTFMDANGDGVGDFEGLMRRLDYLAGLGVTTVWLQPFQPSPNHDDGYDTQDYYGVDPRHGTLGDFVEFTHEARQRGIRVIIDLVINHTSDQHPWFQAARRDERSPYRQFYCWSKAKPPGAHEGMVFPGVQHATWTYDEVARAYYHHRFMPFQPDLNVENPVVQHEIRKIMGFWLELGVSGFRVDAVPFIIEPTPGLTKAPKRGKASAKSKGKSKSKSKTAASFQPPRMRFDYLRELHDFLQWRTGDALLLAEANILPEDNAKYFGPEGDRMHMILNFQVNQHMFHALATGDCRTLGNAIMATAEKAPYSQWGIFLRSHDELDLGRLDEAQRQAVYDAFGPERHMQLYDRGIRRRLAPMLGGDPRRIELAHSLMFGLPGTPVMRYGDEIGMGDDLTLPDRKAVRTPMQWTSDRNGGYSSAQKTELPVVAEGPFSYQRVNVADQTSDPGSLLSINERFIRARKQCPEIGWGTPEVLRTGSPHVLAVRCEWRRKAVVTMFNFTAETRELTIDVPGAERAPLTNVIAREHSTPGPDGKHRITLGPYGHRWYRVGPLMDVIREAV